MSTIFIWVCAGRQIKTWRGDVTSDAIQRCYDLPKTGDRFAYWTKVTGVDLRGHAMVWLPEGGRQ